jgi:hypothetical protein
MLRLRRKRPAGRWRGPRWCGTRWRGRESTIPASARRCATRRGTSLCPGACADRPISTWPCRSARADHLAAVHRRLHDRALDPQPTDKVLEIGTGSGYQAAVLSPLVKEVYSIEIVEPLGRARGAHPAAAGLQQRAREGGRRLSRLARACPVRQDHRHLLSREGPAAAGRPAARRGADDHPRRRALPADAVSAAEEGRQAGG